MTAELVIAGLGCFALAIGHAAIGARRVLPGLAEAGLPRATRTMLRFTWDVITVFLTAFGILLVTLASAQGAETRTLVLRWFAALCITAAARALWDARRRPRAVLRFPVPLIFVVIAALCFTATT